MRTSWLVLSALLLLVAPGCGDDTTTPNKDQGVTVVDMAMAATGDMAHATCAKALACGQTCASKPADQVLQCAAACEAPLKGNATSDGLFLLLLQCLEQHCIPDGGLPDASCIGTAGNGACTTQAVNCGKDK
jgi:hypothetical protein